MCQHMHVIHGMLGKMCKIAFQRTGLDPVPSTHLVVPGNVMPSSGLHGYWTYMRYTYVHVDTHLSLKERKKEPYPSCQGRHDSKQKKWPSSPETEQEVGQAPEPQGLPLLTRFLCGGSAS